MRIPICVKALQINQVVKNSHTIHPSKSYLRISEKKKKNKYVRESFKRIDCNYTGVSFYYRSSKESPPSEYSQYKSYTCIRILWFLLNFISPPLPFPLSLDLSSQITIKQDNTRIEKKKARIEKKISSKEGKRTRRSR